MVVKHGFLISAVGLAIGLGTAAATVRYLSGFLFGVEPFDFTSFSAVGVLLLLIAMLACALPAWRAAKIDAITALKR